MYSFFVLGLIPGTNFQITFQVWLDCLLMVFEVAALWWLQKRGSFDELVAYLPPSFVETCTTYYDSSLNLIARLTAYVLDQWADWEEVTAQAPTQRRSAL